MVILSIVYNGLLLTFGSGSESFKTIRGPLDAMNIATLLNLTKEQVWSHRFAKLKFY